MDVYNIQYQGVFTDFSHSWESTSYRNKRHFFKYILLDYFKGITEIPVTVDPVHNPYILIGAEYNLLEECLNTLNKLFEVEGFVNKKGWLNKTKFLEYTREVYSNEKGMFLKKYTVQDLLEFTREKCKRLLVNIYIKDSRASKIHYTGYYLTDNT